jgi:hypothetical protein
MPVKNISGLQLLLLIVLGALPFLLLVALISATSVGGRVEAQTWNLPNDNTNCPAGCRQIPWKTGSDIWNAGTLPVYSSVPCKGLRGDAKTDDAPAIQACIDALSERQCALLPAGQYLVNGPVRLKSDSCLRGAQPQGAPPFLPVSDPAATTLILGPKEQITTRNFSPGSGHLYPPSNYNTPQTASCELAGTPQKGDTTLMLASSGSCKVSAGTWIEVYGNDDPSLISTMGADGHCDWCGNNNGFYVQQQILEITAKKGNGGSGTTITLSKPLYYTPDTAARTVSGPGGSGTFDEPAGAKYSIITFPTAHAGFENLRFDGSQADIGGTPVILLQGCLECWVKNVETYMTGSSSGSAHVEMDWGYGDEVRDSAFHDQRSGASGSGYGVYLQFSNSDAKVENNIFFHNRHWVVFQGGGSGTAFLYNYADDGYTDDLTYLASGRTSHGAHPYFNLFEGNIISHVAADNFSGTSSHDVFFRNWIWGGESNTVFKGGSGIPNFPPAAGFDAVDLYPGQTYYSFVDNVLGNPDLGKGGAKWATATLRTFNEYAEPSAPVVYSMGGPFTPAGARVPSADTTTILQGNYDYKTRGVAFNADPAAHTYQPSYYYPSKPAFLGSCPFPEQGSDLQPVASLSQPAYQRARGAACNAK